MKELTPLKAIRKFCISCQGSQKATLDCKDTDCPLYAYRQGKNPKRCRGKVGHCSGQERDKSGKFLRDYRAKSRTEKGSVTITELDGKITIEVNKNATD